MPNELQWQKKIVDCVKDHGGYSFKLSHRMMIGVVDLYIKIPGLHGVFLEIKFKKWKSEPHNINIEADLTELQAKHIRDEIKAGGNAGWAFIGSFKKHSYITSGRLDRHGLLLATTSYRVDNAKELYDNVQRIIMGLQNA